MTMAANWEDVRAQLEVRLKALNSEIGAYPGPITGCDAQFNHMLEERTRLNAELTRLDTAAAKGADADALREFTESCPFLAGDTSQSLRGEQRK